MCRKTDTHRFQFRPAISVDKPLIHRWLKQDYIREWIHGAGLESTLTGQIITEFLQAHFADILEVFIDPEKANQRAVHVYQKLGFEIIDEFVASWHPVPHWLMRLNMSALG